MGETESENQKGKIYIA